MSEDLAPRRERRTAEMTVSEARDGMSDVVSGAEWAGTVTYLTRRGRRVAVVVSADDAEWLMRVRAAEDAEDRQAMADNLPPGTRGHIQAASPSEM